MENLLPKKFVMHLDCRTRDKAYTVASIKYYSSFIHGQGNVEVTYQVISDPFTMMQ